MVITFNIVLTLILKYIDLKFIIISECLFEFYINLYRFINVSLKWSRSVFHWLFHDPLVVQDICNGFYS